MSSKGRRKKALHRTGRSPSRRHSRAHVPPLRFAKYLRTRGHGATYEASTPVRVAGFSGVQFDGTIEAKEHAFIPFTPQSRSARWYGDAFFVGKGTVFRIIVLQVRTKAVVIYFDNGALTADEFPAFATKASTILSALRFPK
jgi:hypothetical protein